MKHRIKSLVLICALCLGMIFVDKPMEVKAATSVTITIGSEQFQASFEDNESAKAFLAKCPQSFSMSELNGNEKYRYLDYELPTNETRVDEIKAGDIMLYGSDCIVIFYKSFSTSYSYTRLGKITDTNDLISTVGTGKVNVSFEPTKSDNASISLNKTKLTLKKNKTYRLKLKGADTGKIKWSSTDKKIASVSSKGKIKAKKKGTVTITAKYRGKKYKCRVKIS